MQIKEIEVKNFGPLRNIKIPCDPLTVLVGKNGVGKSSLLRALNLFYHTDLPLDERDFYNEEIENEIIIKIKFNDLTNDELKSFDPYIKGNELAIEKVISYENGRIRQIYYGSKYVNKEFEPFRSAKGQEMRVEYNKLKEKYADFPNYTNREAAEAILSDWELHHKEACVEDRDDGQFFGFQNVGKHRLEKITKFIFIPAVHGAEKEGFEGKDSSISEIMELVVRGSFASDPEFTQIQVEAQEKYSKYIGKAKSEKLVTISTHLTNSLNNYFPDTKINIDWVDEEGVSINVPRAFIKITEEGYENTIDKCGHGLQRAFIITMFQELAFLQSTLSREEDTDNIGLSKTPSIIIGIEEPELYQHPDRQRHLAKTLLQLSEGKIKGVTGKIQAIYSTHSPLLIDYQRFNQIRMFKKIQKSPDKPKESDIIFTNLRNIADFVEDAKGLHRNTITEESLRQRLIVLMNPWVNEGFFSKMVVLVEGVRDRALILGQVLYKKFDLERMGVSVIPCSGKDKITEAIAIFKNLGISVYVVWDSDKDPMNPKGGDGKEANRNILRCFGCTPEDFPSKFSDDFSCVETNLEKTFKDEVGVPYFDSKIQQYCDERELGRPHYVMENPLIISELLEIFNKDAKKSNTLETIVEKILRKI